MAYSTGRGFSSVSSTSLDTGIQDEKPLGRGRGHKLKASNANFISEDPAGDISEEAPLGRARGRGRTRRLSVPTMVPRSPLRRPGEPAIGLQMSAGEQCTPLSTFVQKCYNQEEFRESYKTKLAEHPYALNIPPEVSPQKMADLKICKSESPVKVARKKEAAVSTIWTKPEEMSSKKGTTGVVVMLNANYFQLPTVPNWQLYQYRVDFEPEEDRNAVKHKLIWQHKDKLGGFLFDGTVLFSTHLYEDNPLLLLSLKPSDGSSVRIKIRIVGILASDDYHYLQFFNLLMRRCLDNLKLQLVGRYYHDSSARIPINIHQLELWPGYVTSIRRHEKELLLCTEITHKVMRRDTVYFLLKECSSDSLSQANFKKAILGSIVLTDYNNKTYRVDDVDFSVTPASTFDWNGNQTSYAQYFRQKYELIIKDKHQPMLVSMPKQRDRRRGQTTPIYLVPELCRMTGLTDQMRSNYLLMKDLADCTRLGPSQRMERLQHFNRSLRKNTLVAEELKSWNMAMSENLLSLSGRILPRERIILGNHIKCDAGNMSDWTKELKSHAQLAPEELKSWVVVTPDIYRDEVNQFVSMLRRAACSMDFRLPDPHFQHVSNDRMAAYLEAIDTSVLTFNPMLILVVLPNNQLARYSAIKKKCCVDRAVPTQLILKKNIVNKNVQSVAVKVAIQMNCKIGGAPWTVEIPLQSLMVVGFDVYHDTAEKGRSIGALVASLDRSMSRYFSAVSFHRTGEELSNELSLNMCRALNNYSKCNHGTLPKRIIIYRDGVGEGQIRYVFEHEVAILKAKLQQIYGENEVKMAFIIVTKRINTRLFYDGQNPPSGTIVDDTITLPERYDFFLISQSVRQGTVSPTSYNVISDNLDLEPDKLQRLTYKLTHLYFNWSGTVRVPAPCQYAHKLAYLVGQAIHRAPNSKLEDLLYFL